LILSHSTEQQPKENQKHLSSSLSVLSSLPKGHGRVDLVADCYRDFSIKAGEREKRGASEKIMIKSFNTLVPRDMNSFYSNGENKTQLIIQSTSKEMSRHPK